MTISESPQRQALRELASDECAVCQNRKNPKQSFCVRCYYDLPYEMRAELYRRFGGGYEEAYDAAKSFLLEERKARGRD